MDALTQLIAPLFPGWAASRMAARARLQQAQRYYDAVAPSNQRPRRGNIASADAVMDRAKGGLREYARWLDENHDLCVGILDDLVTNVVGNGAGIEPMAVNARDRSDARDLNLILRQLWAEFWANPEITGEIPGPELERTTCRTWLRDGEMFAQHLTLPASRAPYASRIPYALEPLEADFVPFDLIDPANRIVHGVQKDGWNRPVGYYVSKTHPGNLLPGSRFDTIYKPVESMMHLKFVRRLHQTRGVSLFHAVLTRLDDLKDYEESERIAARVAAAFTAYIKKSSDAASPLSSPDSNGGRNFEMSPGLIFDGLLPGEDVGMIDSKRPNPNLETYRNAMLRAIAAGTGTRFSSIAKDYNGTYSAQRQELVEGTCHYRRLFSYLRDRFYLPVWRRFVDASRAAGLIQIGRGIDLASVYQPEIRPPQMPWIDPLKELGAFEIATNNKFKSRQQVIRDMGGDPATVDAQIEADPLIDLLPNSQPGAGAQNADTNQPDTADVALQEAA